MSLYDILPSALSLPDIVLLVISALMTSLLSAAAGIGGGLLLLVIMANILPLAALIPVHGLVQMGSNTNRMLMTRKHIDLSLIGYFMAGGFIAAIAAVWLVIKLPLVAIQITIGLFVLAMVWGIKPKKRDLPPWLRMIAGFVTTFLSMLVGATGPLVAALIHAQNANKLQLVATFSTCMTYQHGLKLLVFGIAGFAFTDWLGLIALMIASGALGTWLGLKLLNRLPSHVFQPIFKGILTVLALKLLYDGLSGI